MISSCFLKRVKPVEAWARSRLFGPPLLQGALLARLQSTGGPGVAHPKLHILFAHGPV